MTWFTDTASGFQFPVQKIEERDLILWCEQFLTSNGTFLDIGAGFGAYSALLQAYCAQVHAVENDAETYESLTQTISVNNLSAVHTHNIPLTEAASLELESVDFIHIGNIDQAVEIVQSLEPLLQAHTYPPLVISIGPENTELRDYLRQLGYRYVDYVRGYSGRLLANDHPSNQKYAPVSVIKDQYEAGKEITNINALAKLAVYYLNAHMYADAYDCADAALEQNPPPGIALNLKEAKAVAAYYCGYLVEGDRLVDELRLNSHLSFPSRNKLLGIQGKFSSKITLKRRTVLNIPIKRGYNRSSSGLVPYKDGFRMNVRVVNYLITPNGQYISRSSDGTVWTTNYLVHLDSKLQVQDIVEMVEKNDTMRYPVRIRGNEDLRLFDSNKFMTMCADTNPQGIPQVCYGEFNDEGEITKLHPFQLTESLQCEKNWLPFLVNGQTHFIYSWQPLRIYRVAHDQPELIFEKTFPQQLSSFRGSAPPIPYQDGWLCVIHEVYHAEGGRREYFHRLVWLSTDYQTLRFSHPFHFQAVDVEYCVSICHSAQGLLIPYSFRDGSSILGIVDYPTVDVMLNLN